MKKRPATSVLIVKFDALGDVLRTTSLLEPLRRRGARRIWWLTGPAALPLLGGGSSVDRALSLRLDDPAAAARMARRLSGRFDLVLSLEEHPAAAAVARAACRGELVGVTEEGGRLSYTASSARYYDMSLLNRGADGSLAAANSRKAANRLSYSALWLDILGLKAPRAGAGPVLSLTGRDRAAARRLAASPELRGRPVPLALNCGAGGRWPAKQVSEAKAARLAVALGKAFGRPVLLLGGKEEREMRRNRRIAARAARLAPAFRPVLTPYLPLRSFAGLVELCAAMVTTDSLAFHVAGALGVPAVVLVGPTSAAELDFRGRGRVLLPPGGCSCFYAARCSRAVHCLDDIPESSVTAAVRACLG